MRTHPAEFEQGDALPSRFGSPTVNQRFLSSTGSRYFCIFVGVSVCDFAVQHSKKFSTEVLPDVLKYSGAVLWLTEENRM